MDVLLLDHRQNQIVQQGKAIQTLTTVNQKL